MASRGLVTMSMVLDFFKNHSAQFKRGENSYRSGYVSSIHYDLSLDPPLIKGTVAASMKQRVYDVEMIVDENNIKRMSCSCPRGLEVCHHMASFALYCHYNVSSTDMACVWNRPKLPTTDDIKSVDEMFPAKPFTAVRTQVVDEKVAEFRENLRKCHVVGFSWLLRPEPSVLFTSIVPDVNDIIFSKGYLNASDKEEFFCEKCRLDLETIKKIEEDTKGQVRNENWLVAKKFRLTASKFGRVLDACRVNRFPPSLFKSLTGFYNLEGVKAIQWGRENENMALEVFEEKTGLSVIPSGLWLHECGYLGASPDGIINEESILEMKCPYEYRNMCAPLKDERY